MRQHPTNLVSGPPDHPFFKASIPSILCCFHRRRINTDEKAKVVAAAWGIELIQFIAALAVFHQDDLKKG